MVRPQLFKALAIGGAAWLLVSCSTGNVASGISADEIAGTWSANAGFDAQLILAPDGTLEATDWPESLACRAGDAADVADLRASETNDFSGSWQPYGGTLAHQVTLSFDEQVCPVGGAFAHIWRNSDDSLDLCIKVPLDVSSDMVRGDRVFVLHQTPHSGGGHDESCL